MSGSRWTIFSTRLTAAVVLLAGLCGVIVAREQPAATGDQAPPAVPPADADSPPAPKSYELRYKFNLGQVDRYEVRYDMEMDSTYKGATEKVYNESQTHRSYKVTQIGEDGAAALELSIDWVRMKALFDNGENPKNPPKPIEFQSDDPKKRPTKFQHIMASIGRPTATIRFNPQGKAVEVVAVQNGQEQRTAEGQPAGIFTSHENYLIPLPEKPVTIDGTWSEEFHIICRDKTQDLKRVTFKRTYRLESVADGLATIAFSTSILSSITDQTIRGQLIYRETAGKVRFDLERGRMVSRDSAIDRTVVDALGPSSAMHAVIHYHEMLLSDEKAAALEPAEGTAAK